MLFRETFGEGKKCENVGRIVCEISQSLRDRDFSNVAEMAIRDLFGNVSQSKNPLADAVSSANHHNFNFPNLPVNTYPYGTPTDKIFPTLIVTCDKKGNLFKAFDHAATQSLAYGGNPLEEVIILTNVWDTKEFRENIEEKFIIAEQKGVRISIFLVTDYSAFCLN